VMEPSPTRIPWFLLAPAARVHNPHIVLEGTKRGRRQNDARQAANEPLIHVRARDPFDVPNGQSCHND
jgi:hypothetical protein